jgi:uncharacterized protein (TIGR03790 family)
LLALAVGGVAQAGPGPAHRVLVLYNESEPESKPLAIYYAEKRGIPKEHVCGLRVRNAETITRREFNEQIREPLRKYLLEHGLLFEISKKTFDNKFDCLALMYGMPLRIDSDPTLSEDVPEKLPAAMRRNEASVDSELTTLPSSGERLIGWLANPFFHARTTRFTAPLNNTMLLVGRIDGPTPAIARRLIDDALATERYGLLGRCYFDSRNTQDAGYVAGDQWIKESYALFRAAGYECELEETGDLIPEDYPMTDAAVYAGWYAGRMTGPFQRPDFHFRRGAVAYHLHSSSATTLRTESAYWVGPLLAKGAAASFGHVFEPYLAVTPQLDLFFQRLLDGASYVEAGWYSQSGLSWQTTFVGDPLYRPFAVTVDEQISRLENDHQPDLDWAYLRKVNLLMAQGETNNAVQLCRAKAASLNSPVLAEKLGDLLPASERVTAYEAALKTARDSYRYLRIALKLATAYTATRQPNLALVLYEGLVATHPKGRNAKIILQKARDLANLVGEADKAAAFQAKLDALRAGDSAKKK